MNLSPSGWWECRVRVRPAVSELCALALWEAGCSGVWVLDSDFVDDGENARLEMRDQAVVTGYLTEPGLTEERCLQSIKEKLLQYEIEAQPECEWMPAQDWAENWRENFPPLEAGPFLVTAPWHEMTSQNALQISIDPGLAFGTGQHPTTHLCLEMLAKYDAEMQPATVLDVGCGSGILSIAAAKLAETQRRSIQVIASDMDPWCVAATRDNATRNGVQLEMVEAAGLDWCKSTFDLIVANLMSDVLIALAPELARVAHSGSMLIVSGISLPRAPDVQKALEQARFDIIEKRIGEGEVRDGKTEEWVAMALRFNENAAR